MGTSAALAELENESRKTKGTLAYAWCNVEAGTSATICMANAVMASLDLSNNGLTKSASQLTWVRVLTAGEKHHM